METTPAKAPFEVAAPALPHDLAGQRVLIVEDQCSVADLLSTMVHALGCRIAGPCSEIEDARAQLGSRSIGVALIDTQLETGDGVAFASELRRGGVATVLMTGFGAEIRSRPDGSVEIAKPFGEQALAAAIRRALTARASAE